MSLRLASARAAVASLILSTAFLAACGGSSSSSSSQPGPAPTVASVTPTSGSSGGGDTLVLAGTNFVTGATVTVGGAAATGVTVTATAITFTAPARAAGAADLVVTNPDAQSATLAGGYTYLTPVDATWVVPDAAAALDATRRAAFTAGTLYANAHSTAHASGELRGQLDATGTAIRLASLDTAQEGLTGAGFGAGILQVDTVSRQVRGFVITSGLTSITNAHVHRGVRGTSGGPVINLVATGIKDLWVVPDGAPALSTELVTAFQAGELYYNVHTAANTAGEIRGQLDKSGTIRLASLDAAQETGVTSTALGGGIFAVNPETGAVSGFAVTTGLGTVNNAHIHAAVRGSSAGALVPMTFGPNLVVVPDGAAPLTTTAGGQVEAFLGDGHYVNVHTTANTAGEIRGQIDKTGDVRVTTLTGAQESPAVATSALGAGLVAVDATTGEVSGFVVTRGLVSPTISHVHPGARGSNGAPVLDLAKP